MKRFAVISLFVVAGVLRFVNLGYSDYQGDEIKALYNPKEMASTQYFLEQRKGPMQFLVTAGLKTLTPDYRNRLLVRFPFALAGFGSVIIFYYFAKGLFNPKIAFYSTIFFATNGFLLAFSRIVQYQSLVIFFGLLASYLTYLYTKSMRVEYLILGFVGLALSILSHYDGIFFAPIILGLLLDRFLQLKERPQKHALIKHFLGSSIVLIALAGLFYIPFVLNLAKSTTDYWAGRITGDVSGKISSSRYLFSVYQPIYVLHVYTILAGIGLVSLFGLSLAKILPKPKSKTYSFPTFDLSHQRFSLPILMAVLLWTLIPFIIMEVIVYIPGTHIYTYLIPGFLLMGFTLFHIDFLVSKYINKLGMFYQLGIWVMVLFLALQSYFIFVDHNPEYPWQDKRFLVWTLKKPVGTYHLSLFGFPYYRHWEEVAKYLATDNKSEYYSTNERVTISRHYVTLVKDGNKLGYYVFVHYPQTLIEELSNKRVVSYASKNPPIVSYRNANQVVTEVYLLP